MKPTRTITPIKPSEVVEAKKSSLPDFVLVAFNSLIGERWDGYSSRFTQEEIVAKMLENTSSHRRPTVRGNIFKYNWLDVEDIYRKEGWKVEFDKPGYNETYDAFFVFKKK